MIFETHAHYDDDRFNDDRDAVIASLPLNGIEKVINVGASIESTKSTLRLAEKYDFIYAAVGVHPSDIGDLNEETLEWLDMAAKHEKVVAVGEIGLDYHYDFSPRERQIEIFERQLILANKLNLPVIVHDREAHEDTMNLLKKHRPKGVVHCFSGSAEMAKEIVKLGMYIGIGGAVTFKNAKNLPEVIKNTPLDKLLLETDAPYMTPVPYRGKRCDSAHIAYTAEKIAEVKGMDVQELIDICNDNAKKLFEIK